MAYLDYTPQALTMRVSDRVTAGTKCGQQAEITGFHFLRDRLTKAAQVNVDLEITPFALLDDGTLGEELTGKIYRCYTDVMNAANDTLVEQATGAVLAIRQGRNDADWQALIDRLSTSRDTMLQGDWFDMLCTSQAVEIAPLLLRFLADADAKGFFLR